MSFTEIMYEFVGSNNVAIYVLHLDRATERLPVIADLETKLNTRLPIFPACEGNEFIRNGHPTKCINDARYRRSPGDIGCTVSHINICRHTLSNNYDFVVIFEDDCTIDKTLDDIRQRLGEFKALNKSWDLFCIGGRNNGVGIDDIFMKLEFFYGTHAVILNKKFMRELILRYETYYNSGRTWAIDGIYSNVLRSGKCTGYGFRSHTELFYQKTELPSYILSDVIEPLYLENIDQCPVSAASRWAPDNRNDPILKYDPFRGIPCTDDSLTTTMYF